MRSSIQLGSAGFVNARVAREWSRSAPWTEYDASTRKSATPAGRAMPASAPGEQRKRDRGNGSAREHQCIDGVDGERPGETEQRDERRKCRTGSRR